MYQKLSDLFDLLERCFGETSNFNYLLGGVVAITLVISIFVFCYTIISGLVSTLHREEVKNKRKLANGERKLTNANIRKVKSFRKLSKERTKALKQYERELKQRKRVQSLLQD